MYFGSNLHIVFLQVFLFSDFPFFFRAVASPSFRRVHFLAFSACERAESVIFNCFLGKIIPSRAFSQDICTR